MRIKSLRAAGFTHDGYQSGFEYMLRHRLAGDTTDIVCTEAPGHGLEG